MSWAGYNTSIAANRYKQMFITNYLDISGRLLVNSGDVSFNDGNLYVAGNMGIGMVANSGYELDVAGDVRNNGNLVVLGDVSLNSRLVVGDDITTNKRLFTVGDTSLNGNLFAAFDTSLNGNLQIGSDITINKRLFTIGDVSLNGNLFSAFDTSLNGNLSIGKDLTIKGRLNVQNYTNQNIINTTTTNYQLIVSEDLSLNGRLVVSGDSSFNGSLYAITQAISDNSTKVATTAYARSLVDASLATYYTKAAVDASINAGYYNKAAIDASINTSYYNKEAIDASVNIALALKSNIASPTFTGIAIIPTANITTLNTFGDASLNSRLVVGSDVTVNKRLFTVGDASLNGKLFVALDTSLNGNISLNGRFSSLGDISVNTFTIGRGGGNSNTNTVFGLSSLNVNTAGIQNVAMGYQSLKSLTTGIDNAAFGYNSLSSLTTGNSNTGMGPWSLHSLTTGSANMAVGSYSLQTITTQTDNVGMGKDTLAFATTSFNTAVGSRSLREVLTGSNNTAVGYQAGTAGTANTTGSNNTYIGFEAQANAHNYSDSTAIGAGSIITGSYQVVLGRSTEKVFIPGDTSMNGKLIVNGDSSFNGNLYAITQAISDNSTEVATTAYTRSLLDASLGNYYTKSAIDASINTNYYNKTAIDANIALKSNIASPTFTGIAIIPTANITTLNTFGDASMNGALRLGKDLTINGRLNVQNYTNNNIINTTVNNYQLIISEDLSLNGRLVVAGGDASFNGNIKAVGNVTAAALYASSDYRIKSNIQPLSDTSFSIDLLNPITYLNAKLGRQDIGFIAHEVQEHLPFLVNGEKDGAEYQSVNYNGIIGLLTNEIQELKKQNVILNEKIKNIEERLS